MVQRKKVSDIIGKIYNRLTVVDYLGLGKYHKHYWLCLCGCGKSIVLNTSRITGHNPTKSCGCLRIEKLKLNRHNPIRHGHLINNPRLYRIYQGMKSRCYNKNNPRYLYYGLKGVVLCEEWLNDVNTFVEWSLHNGYEDGLTIDRVNSSSNYTPENCEWVSASENSRRMNATRANAKLI